MIGLPPDERPGRQRADWHVIISEVDPRLKVAGSSEAKGRRCEGEQFLSVTASCCQRGSARRLLVLPRRLNTGTLILSTKVTVERVRHPVAVDSLPRSSPQVRGLRVQAWFPRRSGRGLDCASAYVCVPSKPCGRCVP